MKRIARYQVISFPNFAFYRNRLEFILRGAMPTHMLFDYRWYTTGHIHQLSLRDFRYLVQSVDGLTERGIYTIPAQNPIKQFFIQQCPNLFMLLPIVILETTECVR
jgi:methionine biosynthesis protein MetW